MIFTTPYAKISNWMGWQTTHNGPKRRGAWNVDYNWHSESWVCATLINAAGEYRAQCRRTGIEYPYPTSYWAGGDALNKLNIRAVFKEGTGDMFAIRANRIRIYSQFTRGRGNKETDNLYAVTFHELAHASHYNKVGNNYWIKYINYIVTYGAYGKGIGNNAGLCALGEAWGYHMGYRLTLNEFGNTNSRVRLNAFENFDPLETGDKDDDIFSPTNLASSWRGWIPAGIMHDITDTNRDWVRTGFRDEVSGYTHRDLYDALDSDVDTPQEFRDRLLRENSNRDQSDLRSLFEAHYWN